MLFVRNASSCGGKINQISLAILALPWTTSLVFRSTSASPFCALARGHITQMIIPL